MLTASFSGFTAAANVHFTSALRSVMQPTAYVLPAANVGTVVVFKWTAQYDGGNRCHLYATAAG